MKNGFITQELFEKIVHQVSNEPSMKMLCFGLQYEPLLDKRVFQWVKYFKSLCKNKIASIITNGELINEFPPEEILRSGINLLIISLNAHTELTFSIINKGIDYKRVIGNIDSLISNDALKYKIVLSFVRTKINEREIDEALFFWHKRGIKTNVLSFANRAGMLESYDCYEPITKQKMGFERIKGASLQYYIKRILKACPLPFTSMCVLFNGDIILCCEDWRRGFHYWQH